MEEPNTLGRIKESSKETGNRLQAVLPSETVNDADVDEVSALSERSAEEPDTLGRMNGSLKETGNKLQAVPAPETVTAVHVDAASSEKSTEKPTKLGRITESLKKTQHKIQAIFAPASKQLDDGAELAQCIRLADGALGLIKLDMAAEYYERALLLIALDATPNTSTLAHCLKNLIDVYTFVDNPLKALDTMRRLRQINGFTEPESNDLTILTRAASALERENRHDEAEATYREAAALAREMLPVTDPLIQRLDNSCIEIQEKTTKSLDSEPANSNALDSLSFESMKFDEEGLEQELERYLKAGDDAVNRLNFQLASECYGLALLMLGHLQTADKARTKHCLDNLSDAYMFLNKPDKAVSIIDQLWKLDREHEASAETVKILAKKAAACTTAHLYVEAEATYRDALMLACRILPPTDPLIEKLNNAFISTHKSQAHHRPNNLADEQGLLNKSQAGGQSLIMRKQSGRAVESSSGSTTQSGQKRRFAGSQFGDARLRRVLGSPLFTLVASVILILASSQICVFLLQSAKPAVPTNFAGQQFESCDHKTTIKFLSKDQCTIYKSGRSTNAGYSFLARNQWNLSRFWKKQSELWYRYDGSSLVDKDTIAMYPANSPELAVAKKMWWYADFAQQQYIASGAYPSDAEKCKQSDSNFRYTNPITGRPDYAAIILQKKKDNMNWTSKDSDRHWRPGAIVCICIGYKNFLVQGYDRYGKLLTGSDPSQFFTIECQNGINLTRGEQAKQQFYRDNEVQIPAHVVLYE